jgi:hypothetical protein
MENPGERLVGDYLRYVKGCDFIDFNVYTKLAQGDIDVIGVDHAKKRVYICEVVTHLTTGIQYVKNARPDTADRLIKKFVKDINYGAAAFRGYAVLYMLWSPVVHRSTGTPQYDQFAHLARVRDEIRAKTAVEIQFVTNEDYGKAIDALRAFAARETKELKSPVMRFLQIEEWCRKNCNNIAKRRSGKLGERQLSSTGPERRTCAGNDQDPVEPSP